MEAPVELQQKCKFEILKDTEIKENVSKPKLANKIPCSFCSQHQKIKT